MTIRAEMSVTSVTVYPDRARITAVGDLTLVKGAQKVTVDNLPLAMIPDSIRVGGRGTTAVQIKSVEVNRLYFEEVPSEKVRDIEKTIEQTEDELRAISDKKSVLASQIDYLDGLRKATKQYAKGLARGSNTVEAQGELSRYVQEQDERYRAETRQLENERRSLNHRLEKLQNELSQLRSARPKERNQALVDVEALEQGEFQLEIHYVVVNAGWKPLYDIRLKSSGDGHELTLEYLAEVTQSTGEDWEDIALSVSTARPALNQRLPEIKPWYVDVFSPIPVAPAPKRALAREPRAEASMGVSLPQMMATAAMEPDSVQAQQAVASAEDTGVAVTFKVAGRTDIPGDGSGHKITIQSFALRPDVDYLAIPKHTDAVFRRAKATYPGPGPLLEGKASLFVEEEFIGSTELEYTPAGGELELLLGVEERIAISRELVRRDVDKRRLRDKRKLAYGYEIEIENLLAEAIGIELQDQIPVSRHEDISVELESVAPKPAESSDLNILEWNLEVEAGEKELVRFEFQVEHPRSLRIIGLLD